MSTGVIKCKEACGVNVLLLAQKDFLKGKKDICSVPEAAKLKPSLPGTSAPSTDQLVNGQHATLIDVFESSQPRHHVCALVFR